MPLTGPSRNIPLPVQVADQIRALIADGSWPVGHRVPPEHRLSADLGISRNSVREALRSLVHAGLLEARAGDGTYVRATSELEVSLRRRVRDTDPREAFEVRSLLETRAAELAATHATADQRAGLRRALAERDTARDGADLAAFVARDLDFHALVVASCGNALLAELHGHIRSAIAANIVPSPDPHTDTALDAAHHRLLDAIESGDGAAAGHIAAGLVAEARQIHEDVTGAHTRPADLDGPQPNDEVPR